MGRQQQRSATPLVAPKRADVLPSAPVDGKTFSTGKSLQDAVISEDDLAFLESAAVMALDFSRVGELLASAVCAAALLRHVYPRDTARHYLHPDDPEGQFVRDVVAAGRTEDLEQRWFGGDAARLGLIVRELSGGGLDFTEVFAGKERPTSGAAKQAREPARPEKGKVI